MLPESPTPMPITPVPSTLNKETEKTSKTFTDLLFSIGKGFARLWFGCSSALGSLLILAILFFFFLFLSNGFRGNNEEGKRLAGTGPETIAVVSLSGVIAESNQGSGLFSTPTETITPSLVKGYVDRVIDETNVKAVIFRLDSPGGTLVASDRIYEEMEKVKSKGKKVIFLYGETAASGGYYISSNADKIVANPQTLTGSIGVIASVLNVKGLYDKLGLEEEVYKTGKNKDLLNPTRERTQEEVDFINALLDQALEQFIDRVAAGRKMDKEVVRKIADGSVFTGKEAKELKLIDELGNFDKAVEVAKREAGLEGKDPLILEYSSPSFWQSFFSAKIFDPLSLLGFNSQTSPKPGVRIEYLLTL